MSTYIAGWILKSLIFSLTIKKKKSFESALYRMHVGQVIKYMYRIII